MTHPLVSIITPVFNRQDLIGQTIRSVLSQSLLDWEMLVVDDGSTDNTWDTVRSFARRDSRIKPILRNQKPQGAPTCRNIGIEQAKGKYVIFLDSDDLLSPFALEQRTKTFASHRDMDFLVFQTIVMSSDLNKELRPWHSLQPGHDHIKEFLSLRSPWQTAGAIWQREALHRYALRFDPRLKIWQDVDFHLQALLRAMHYKIMTDYPADVQYRQHGSTLSQRAYTKKQRKSQIYFVRKYMRIFRQNSGYKQLLLSLTDQLISKNLEQRYFLNAFRLFWLKITNLRTDGSAL